MPLWILKGKIDYNTRNIHQRRLPLKKIFSLQSETKHPDRVIEAIKHEIRKYLKRERTKKLPAGSPFWIFECRVGKSAQSTNEVLAQELLASLDTAHAEKWAEFYVEIIAKPAKKSPLSEQPKL